MRTHSDIVLMTARLQACTDLRVSGCVKVIQLSIVYTAKNANRLVASRQFYRLVATCQQVASICQFHQVVTSLLSQACCDLSFADLLQLVETICSKPVCE